MKQRATLDEQINTLVSHGVTFDLMDEEKARRFLSNNSYFFKIKSYENNYRKTIDESGGYVYDNLDFGHLVELSLVDFALSRLVWSMCSSIEHSIKVRFNQLIMKDQNPDIADICVIFSVADDPPPCLCPPMGVPCAPRRRRPGT